MAERSIKKPLKLNKKSCDNISSNCIIWQGPSIDCINLCKGDSITEVIYEIATEFCNLYQQFDPAGYNTTCLNLVGCPPDTFKELFQALIDKVCKLVTDVTSPCGLIVNIEQLQTELLYKAVVTGGSGNYTYKWSNPQNKYKGGQTLSVPTTTTETLQIIQGIVPANTIGVFIGPGVDTTYPQADYLNPLYLTCWVTDTASGCTQQGTYLVIFDFFN